MVSDDREVKFTSTQIDELTARAGNLLDQLRDILGEMSERMQALSGDQGQG